MVSSQNKKSDIEADLKNWLSNARKVVIAGIGNSLRRDDFVGVEIVRNLQNRVSQAVHLIECETVPESFIEPIIEFNPTHILIIDAAMLDLKPGHSRLTDPSQMLKYPATSTHTLPLRILCEYLAKTTGAKIAVLVIQPEDTSFVEGLTPSLRKTTLKLTSLLSKFLP